MAYILQSGLPVWKVSIQVFILISQLFILLSKEQLYAILLSLRSVLMHDTVYLCPYNELIIFSLEISITLIVESSLAVSNLLESSVNDSPLIDR